MMLPLVDDTMPNDGMMAPGAKASAVLILTLVYSLPTGVKELTYQGLNKMAAILQVCDISKRVEYWMIVIVI